MLHKCMAAELWCADSALQRLTGDSAGVAAIVSYDRVTVHIAIASAGNRVRSMSCQNKCPIVFEGTF